MDYEAKIYDAAWTRQAIAQIDEANSQDPNTITIDGEARPEALCYGEWMTAWVEKIRTTGSTNDMLLIAARAQHIRRWEMPRSDFPDNRKGYLEWRNRLGEFHGECTGEILKAIGYEEEFIDQVAFRIQKKCLKTNWDSQTIEDAACLIFLEHYFDATLEKTGERKMIRILQKTWVKMSEPGHQLALALDLDEGQRSLIEDALGGEVGAESAS